MVYSLICHRDVLHQAINERRKTGVRKTAQG